MLVPQNVQMVSAQDITYGIFKEEIKNRFLCLVNIDGKDTICYIPSSCRLSNFINLEGKTVLLKPVASANTRTHYSVFAVKIGRSTILLNLSMANRIVERQLQRRSFAYLGKRSSVSREHLEAGYKADLFIHDTKTIVEVKGLLSCSKDALFPTVFSERAVAQLHKIEKLLNIGYKVSYIIISFNPAVHNVSINHDDIRFREAFLSCVNKGMQCRVYSIRLHNGTPVIGKRLSMHIEQKQGILGNASSGDLLAR